MPSALVLAAWQQPYVNVFKLCDVDNLKEVDIQGDVVQQMVRRRTTAFYTFQGRTGTRSPHIQHRKRAFCSAAVAVRQLPTREVGCVGHTGPLMILLAASQDRVIGKKVFKIRGLIPAANYVRVPKLKSQTLGLTGRFLYMQVTAETMSTCMQIRMRFYAELGYVLLPAHISRMCVCVCVCVLP